MVAQEGVVVHVDAVPELLEAALFDFLQDHVGFEKRFDQFGERAFVV